MRTIVHSGLIARHIGVFKADVAFENGRIVEVGENLPREGAECIDATECIVMPGGVDAHTRMTICCDALVTAKGQSKEGFAAGTMAAAYGGTTCIVEYPFICGQGKEHCCPTLEEVLSHAQKEAMVDFALHSPRLDKVDALAAAKKMGCVSVRLPFVGDTSDASLWDMLKAAHEENGLAVAHCENEILARGLREQLQGSGRRGADTFALSRPPLCEEEAIFRTIIFAKATKASVYLTRLSTRSALAQVQDAQRSGFSVFAETCPQYLLLDESSYQEGAAEGLKYVMTPPLRTPKDNTALWDGLKTGAIDVVASDHRAITYARKWLISENNVFHCPVGVPGVETRVPLLFSEGVLKGRLTLPRFVQVVSEAPARLMGLPQKGRLEPGADADVVILDPTEERYVTAGSLHQKTDYTPFESMHVRGWPRDVWLRGQRLLAGNQFLGQAGGGRYVMRADSAKHSGEK